MTRVRVIVEGQTEESFIKNVLAPLLAYKNVYLTPLVLGVPGHKGGNVNYARVKKDVLLQLKQDRNACCSTMLDLYGLGAGFPGRNVPQSSTGLERARHIEQAIFQDIVCEAPELRPEIRFFLTCRSTNMKDCYSAMRKGLLQRWAGPTWAKSY